MELPIHNNTGEVVGQLEVNDRVFGAPMNQDLLHQAMVFHMANQRQGTHSTKKRDEVSGGGRKPYAQKGTGRARQGSIRSPQFRHGGIVFGPTPRDYAKKLPKRMRQQAIRIALSGKVEGGKLVLVQELDMEPKTKAVAALLSAVGVSTSTLMVVGPGAVAVAPAVRNLEKVKTLSADLLNVLDLVRYDRVIMTVEAAQRADALWGDTRRKVAAAS